jgi:LytS/YehU family sensor histidine kinase
VFIRFALLAVILYIANGIMQVILSNFYVPVNFTVVLWSPGVAMIFRLNVVVAGLLVYHWSTKEEKRALDEVKGKLELSTLRELKARAELDALQSKVNPHFLYNSLNSIYTLIDQQPEKGKEMIQQLSKLFRLSINNNDRFLWTIREELELVDAYLSIERVRFGDKLEAKIECAPGLLSCVIPRFTLQPLVENAIKHGISSMEGTGKILITVADLSEWLELTVHDNGVDFTDDLHTGFGLRSVRDKVKSQGNDATLEIFGTAPNKYVKLKMKRRESADY